MTPPLMTLGNFLKAFCINKNHKISILTHDDNIVYFIEGKEINFTKNAYFDPELKMFRCIDLTYLQCIVSNFTCYDDVIRIYIKGE